MEKGYIRKSFMEGFNDNQILAKSARTGVENKSTSTASLRATRHLDNIWYNLGECCSVFPAFLNYEIGEIKSIFGGQISSSQRKNLPEISHTHTFVDPNHSNKGHSLASDSYKGPIF